MLHTTIFDINKHKDNEYNVFFAKSSKHKVKSLFDIKIHNELMLHTTIFDITAKCFQSVMLVSIKIHNELLDRNEISKILVHSGSIYPINMYCH